MNSLRKLIGLVAFSMMILALPSLASAQWRDRDRDDDYYGNRDRNDDYNRNGNYNRNLQSTVKNLKNRSRQFERRLDRALDNSRYDDRRREDNLNGLADSFRRATEDLDNAYDNRRDYNRSYDEARRVLDLGRRIDRAISRARLDGNVMNEWNRISYDLETLADAYGYNNRNNRNNRNNGNRRVNIPFPFPF